MEKSKLWQLCQQIPPAEWSAIDRWVSSPYFNRKDQLIRLWAKLRSCLQHKQHPELTSTYLEIFPNEKELDLAKLRLAMSDLYLLLLDFLAAQERKQTETNSFIHQARALRRLNLPKLANQQLKKAWKDLEGQPLRNTNYLNTRYELISEQYGQTKQSKSDSSKQLQALSNAADEALIAAKLKQACLAIAHHTVYTAAHEIGFTEQAMAYAKERDLINTPAIGLYYHCFLMLQHQEGTTYYQTFKSSLLEHIKHFPPAEIRELLLMGINYCIKQVNRGDESYFDEITALYRIGLQEDYLIEHGQLSRFTYYNIVAAGLRSGDYEWVEGFIYKYQPKLERLYRESSFSFCLARLYYARKEHDHALPLLQKANYRDPLLNLGAKTLLLKIYYENGVYDPLNAHLDAMENYIRRKKVIGYHRTNYRNIVRLARALSAVNPYDEQARLALRQEIESSAILTERDWFLNALKR